MAFAYTHAPIDFYFKKDSRNFCVQEVPLYDFAKTGDHIIAKIAKKDLTTQEAIKIFSCSFGVMQKDIGYAGLKDKHGYTIQYFSFPNKAISQQALLNFQHENLKILDIDYHSNKLKRGHLKGNRFFCVLKKVSLMHFEKIKQVTAKIAEFGIPNYFGYQRFGYEGDNFLLGRSIVHGQKKFRSKQVNQFLISAYQSHLFNQWLSLRLQISHIIHYHPAHEIYEAIRFLLRDLVELAHLKQQDRCKQIKDQTHIFKLLDGDCMCHYPHGRHFSLAWSKEELSRFLNKEISVMGLLSGKKALINPGMAGALEQLFCDEKIPSVGQRRYAWIFPQDLTLHYKEEKAQLELRFFLPKGAYATNLLREVAHQDIKGIV